MTKHVMTTLAGSVLAAVLLGCGGSAPEQPKAARPAGPTPLVIPVPRDYARGDGAFRLAAPTEVVYSGGATAAEAANYFIEHLKGDPEIYLQPAKEGDAGSGRVAFVLDANAQGFGPEEYALSIKPDGIVVHAHDAAGLFYGAVTLWQEFSILPPQGGVSSVGSIEIRDAPRFAWRGLHARFRRHFQSPEFVKQFIDRMALHKLNVAALAPDRRPGLADRDQEVPAAHRRSARGACRRGPAAQPPTSTPRPASRESHGGFYTQDDRRARSWPTPRQRHITRRAGDRDARPRAGRDRRVSAARRHAAEPARRCRHDWGVYRTSCSTSTIHLRLPRGRADRGDGALPRPRTSTSAATRR